MRWPFPNWLRGMAGRDDPSPGPADGARATADDARGAPNPDLGSSPAPDRDVGRAPWRDLPPVQRAVGAIPLTAPSAEFARGLAGRRVPDPMLAPLGHDVTADGPAGLVSGIAVPLVQRAGVSADPRSSVAVPPAAVPPAVRGRARQTLQRGLTTIATLPRSGAVTDPAGIAATKSPNEGAVSPAAAERAPAGDLGPAEHAPTAEHAPAGELAPGGELAPAAHPAAALPDLALRTLPVARLATGVPAIAATRVADASAPALVLALAPSSGAGLSVGESSAPTGTSGSSDAAVIASRATGAVPAAPPEAPAAAPPAAAPGGDHGLPVPTRRTLGESRRLGLGAPLTERPPLAGREIGRSDLPVARLHRSADPAITTSAHPPIPTVVPAAAAASSSLPRLVVARRSATVQPAAAASEAAPPAPGPVDHGPSATTASSVGEPADQPADEQASPIIAELTADAARPLVGDAPIGISRLVRGDPAVTDAAATTDAEWDPEPSGSPLHLAAASRALPAMAGEATDPARGAPSADVRGMPATGDPGGPRALAALQRSLPAADRGVAPSAQGVATAGRPVLPVMPLVAARPLRVGPPIGPVTVGAGSAFEPAPVVARFAIPWAGPGIGVDAVGATPFGAFARPSARAAPAPASHRDERPVVARSALATGRGPSPASSSALLLARSAVGWDQLPTAGPDEAAGRSGGAISWAAGAGFTTVAPTPGPFVQRAVAIDELSVTPGGASAGTAGPGAAAGAGQPGAGGPGTDYEELAEHVYDKIRARLTTELLLDRERTGLLVDG